ncbi:TonB-linked SusC/RagA family outer membrane protein [Dysgonomonas hofstadii]|uniref:TonB-linked SusC/RagA family outer membrane protein n=1 Tax=Dysgonomonas hofstadii TaxID=637886 RepID=A0A840CPE7_9BACT|nr:SusC/RagA family TonB-linked outer membrane protein [Dysgonomonas hofstadii]MBB4037266.1 TonB-linked SusC/RagA family outer membrane protein [Dysgonomonas hofstadii]
MRIIKYILLLFVLFSWGRSQAQEQDNSTEGQRIVGLVLDANTREPLESVQVSSADLVRAVVSGPRGFFRGRTLSGMAELNMVKEGYYTARINLLGRDSVVVYMQNIDKTLATDTYTTPDGERSVRDKTSAAEALDIKDINRGYFSASDALTGRFAGLRVLNKSGMVGEGSFFNLRGNRTLLGQNTPLLVIDGVPFLTDQNSSNIINGFSPDILEPGNLKNIEQITFLKGAEAMPYGSLGSNGVLMIKTERGKVSRTLVEIQSVEGLSFVGKKLPLLSGLDYSRYIADIAGSRYANSEEIGKVFPFLSGNMTPGQKVRYGFNTDWQKEIYTPAFLSENMIKVRGGDAIVQYLVTAGYQINDGVVDGTSKNKFYTNGNTNINFSDKLKAFASISFDFSDMKLQEQGLTRETNPVLAAYAQSPLTGLYQVDDNGLILTEYAKIDPAMNISNPKAMLSDIEGKNKIYNFLVNTGLNYNVMKNLDADITFGIYYRYIKDDIFIGGLSSQTIAPLMGGLALNTVRSGSSEATDYYTKAGLSYKFSTVDHHLNVKGSWQMISSKYQASSGAGINTTTDRYRTLSNVSSVGRTSGGYADILNWMNVYVKADYNYRQQLYLSAIGIVDAASTYGDYSNRWYVFPGVKAGWKISNSSFLRNSPLISNLMLRSEFSINPNSRYSSAYSNYYYTLHLLRDVSSLVRAGIPNQKIGPERVTNMNLGVDFSLIGDRITLSADVFEEHTRHMIVDTKASPVYGSKYIYKNSGSMRTRGAELSLSGLLTEGAFRLRIGGNIAFYNTRIMSLGNRDQQIIDLGDGVTLINKVGEAPFSYYGHSVDGIYSTTAQANTDGYKNISGYQFTGGDAKFHDYNGDKLITDADRDILGSADPDFFGGFYTKMSWKGFSLFANFAYSYGNKIYNATRRLNESSDGFSNQAASVGRRWVTEGQVTDIPRAVYGDPAGNNRFSSRWIEDGSFVKLKELTISWETRKKLLFMHSFKVFATGENLLCFTDYKGSDPEFAYSYDMATLGMDVAKIPIPKCVKIGIIMNF